MDLFSEEFKIKLSKNTQKKETGCGKCLSIFIISKNFLFINLILINIIFY